MLNHTIAQQQLGSIVSKVFPAFRLRPFGEFYNKNQFSRPAGIDEATTRLEHNVKYFYSNYLVVFALLTVYTMYVNLLLTRVNNIMVVLPSRG
jgi:hypothetical protein